MGSLHVYLRSVYQSALIVMNVELVCHVIVASVQHTALPCLLVVKGKWLSSHKENVMTKDPLPCIGTAVAGEWVWVLAILCSFNYRQVVIEW